MRTTRRWSEAVQSGNAYELLQELRGEAGVARPVSLYRCPCVNTPMAMGIVHTRILLPHLDFDAGELRYVLMHELVHLKRKDLFYRILTLIATAVHWFNPVVYMTGRATTLLSEISCDDEVVRGADADARLRYSETIIGVVKYQSRLKTALSTGFYGGKKGMKMRISSIMDIGKKRLGAALVCAALIMSAGTGFAFAATVSVPAPAVGQYDILDVLRHYESSDLRQSYSPPLEGQISRGEALDIAEASVSRVLDHLTVNSSAFGMGIASSEARLVQTIQPGQDGIDDLPGVQYGFWEVTLFSPDEEVAVFLIHAATGTVWRAEIRGWGFWLPRLMISAEKALSGFMTDLGLEGYPYPVESIITAREQIDTTISRSLPPDNEVFVIVRLTSAPYYVEGTLMEDQVAITLQLELTTQNGTETPVE
jgi:hypothetical protein